MREGKERRVIYLSHYRGTKEADMLLGSFAKAKVDMLTDEELDAFARILERSDLDMIEWIVRDGAPIETDDEHERSVLEMLRHFALKEYRV